MAVGVGACIAGHRGDYSAHQKSLVNTVLQITDVCFISSKLTVMPCLALTHVARMKEPRVSRLAFRFISFVILKLDN